MGDVRWYNDQPRTGQELDVSTWHPYSTPAVKTKGNWGFSASPQDLWNIGKYIGKKLFGSAGGFDAASAAGIPGAGAGVEGAGNLDLSEAALPSLATLTPTEAAYASGAGPAALSPLFGGGSLPGASALPTITTGGVPGVGAGVTGAGTLSLLGPAEASYAAGAGPAALSPLFGGGSLPAAPAATGALSTLAPFAGAALPIGLAIAGFGGLFGGKKKKPSYEELWNQALERYRQESLKDLLETIGSGKGEYPTSAGMAGLSNVLRPTTGPPLKNWEDLYNAAKQYALAQHGYSGFGYGQFKPRTHDLLSAIDHEIGLVKQGVISPEYLKPLQDLRKITEASLTYGTGIFGSNLGQPGVNIREGGQGISHADRYGTSNKYAPFWGYKPVEVPTDTELNNWVIGPAIPY